MSCLALLGHFADYGSAFTSGLGAFRVTLPPGSAVTKVTRVPGVPRVNVLSFAVLAHSRFIAAQLVFAVRLFGGERFRFPGFGTLVVSFPVLELVEALCTVFRVAISVEETHA